MTGKDPKTFEDALAMAAIDAALASGAVAPVLAAWSRQAQLLIDLETGQQYKIRVLAIRLEDEDSHQTRQ